MDNFKVSITLAIVCGLIVGGILGCLVGHYLFPKIKIHTEVIYDSSKEKAKIDSLSNIIKAKEIRITELLDSASKIKTVVVVKEVNKVKDLPMSENVSLLHDNLVKHGELTAQTDPNPSTIKFEDNADTLAILSEANVKDVNIIVAKYEGELGVNEQLTLAVEEGKGLVHQKDSIIGIQSDILVQQDLVYNERVKNLEKNLNREKTTKTVLVSVLGTAAAVFGIIALTNSKK